MPRFQVRFLAGAVHTIATSTFQTVAKLRAMKTDDNLLLLKTNMDAGHGGASGRFERYKLYALEHAFFLRLAGIKE
jgi:protease II